MINSRTDRYLGVVALALLILGCLVVLLPFLTAMLWAAILVSVTWPAFVRLDSLLGKRRTLSALIMALVVAAVVISPFAIVAFGLANNANDLSQAISERVDKGLPEAPEWLSSVPLVGQKLTDRWQELAHDGSQLSDAVKRLIPAAKSALLTAGAAFGQGLLQLTLSVFIAFFLFCDGEAIEGRVAIAVERLAGERGSHLLSIARNTVTGVVYGILGTALAQGVLAGIGFAIAGVPGPLLLGLATFFLSIVPVGPPLIWGGAAIWLYQQGSTGWAIFMVLWGVLVVSMVDNFLKPLIISRGASLPFVLVFLGAAGGVLAFGFIGIFIGPVLLALGYRLMLEWSAIVQARSAGQSLE